MCAGFVELRVDLPAVNDPVPINVADPAPLDNAAPHPARGSYADGYAPVARLFARHLARGDEVGASLCVYRGQKRIVDLWGGLAHVEHARPWRRDTRIVLFSVTKGLAAMAFHLLATRAKLEWDAPVSDYWPAFGAAGKDAITVRQLLNHRGGLPYLRERLTLLECADDRNRRRIRRAMEQQEPTWAPGSEQGYHAITFGLFARELFERIAGEPMGSYLEREVFEPTGSDVRLGTPPALDHQHAELYSPSVPRRISELVRVSVFSPDATEALLARDLVRRDSVTRRALGNPSVGREGVTLYNAPAVRRAELVWASATGTAAGLARAYVPFANDGRVGESTLFGAGTLEPVYRRQSWSDQDRVLHKPLGWSHGFLKEQRHLFSPNPESFGHAGMGGALGWADPVTNLSIGYAMNHMDWRVRSLRSVGLCRALYDCDAMR